MMKVFVLTGYIEYEGNEAIGTFASREEAESYYKSNISKPFECGVCHILEFDNVKIIKYEVGMVPESFEISNGHRYASRHTDDTVPSNFHSDYYVGGEKHREDCPAVIINNGV